MDSIRVITAFSSPEPVQIQNPITFSGDLLEYGFGGHIWTATEWTIEPNHTKAHTAQGPQNRTPACLLKLNLSGPKVISFVDSVLFAN